MKKLSLIITVCLLAIIALICYLKFSESRAGWRLIFLNVGQGDAALIRLDSGEKMLVDCGPDDKILSELGRYLPFYDRTIDYLLVTHPDLDHYGGCIDVLRRYQVRMVIGNGEERPNDPNWPVWKNELAAEKSALKIIAGPESWSIGGEKFEFLAPDDSLSVSGSDSGSNRQTIVFRFIFSGQEKGSVLFAGDMEIPLEDALLARYCSSTPVDCPVLRADILKVGHHGSDTSSGEEFLRAVSPEAALISVGKNSFGHPSLRVLRKLERARADVWRTDEKGDMIVE